MPVLERGWEEMNDDDISRTCTAVTLDPHPLWNDAVETLLGRIGIETVAKATTLEEAVEALTLRKPDVFVTELEVPSVAKALRCIRRVTRGDDAPKVIVLSHRCDLESIEAAFSSGATCYVLKTAQAEEIAEAVRQAVTPEWRPAPLRHERAAGADAVRLTRREHEILRLVAQANPNREIARRLWVTEQTVKFHLTNVYRKLGVCTRDEAARWWWSNGPVLRVHGVEGGSRTLIG
jgi:NarL family two-component system response regulator LiaR